MVSTEGTVRVARRCYVPSDDIGDVAAVCAEVIATASPNSVIVSTTAAMLHGLWLPEGLSEIHVATATPHRAPRSMTRTKRRQLVEHRMTLRDDELMTVDGVPVTTLERTWRDLAGCLGLPALVAAGDSALRSGTTRDAIARVVHRSAGARGIRRARAAFDLLDERSRSRPESHLRVAASGRGRIAFAVNEPIHRDVGGWLAEPDLSLAAAKLALEYQGEDHAELTRMRRDMTRFADLRREGWLVLPYGPAEVFGRPWEIESEVRHALRTRAPHLLPRRVGPSSASGPL